MKEFIERPASNMSLSRRKLNYGVGVNDAWYITSYKNDEGKKVWCPYYQRWSNMIERCYSAVRQKRSPTYAGCTVSNGWLLFSTFRSWMEKQDWRGKHLDKDILVVGNKVYSEDTCIFVSPQLNSLLLDSAAIRGKHPQGVCWATDRGKYLATCKLDGKHKFIGYYTKESSAEYAYCVFKSQQVITYSNQQESTSQPDLQQALLRHAKVFSEKALVLKNIGDIDE